MKIEIEKTNIVRIAYHQEEGDKYYGSCLWAYFDFDLNRYMLSIQSDCGNASYRWVATPKTESFLHLMARCDDGYMLDKLFEPTVVDVDSMIESVRNDIQIVEDDEPMYEGDEEWKEKEQYVEELKYSLEECRSDESAYMVLQNWYNEHDYDFSYAWEFVQKDFSAAAKRIVQIFHDFVQPKIRAILANGGES